jgi:predicted TPR repeat methyltransferase
MDMKGSSHVQELATDVIWQNRLEQIDSEVDDIRFIDTVNGVDQDEEWCEIVTRGEKRRIRFHDYADVFRIPGLYEELFYDRLECCSPSYISNLLNSVVRESGERLEEFRVLDVGAGNGMMGDELQDLGVRSITGIDIIPGAKEATNRDRPDVYDDYRVTDLTDLPEAEEERLRRADANCLTTVAALGFGDIPPLAFAKALDLIATTGWLALNLKESFLREQDESGFSRLIRRLNRDGYIQTLCYRRYQHRNSIIGEPLFYVAVIARKLKDLDSDLLESLQGE